MLQQNGMTGSAMALYPGAFRSRRPTLIVLPLVATLNCLPAVASAAEFRGREQFLQQHCYDCHADGAAEGGLDLRELRTNLDDEGLFAKWEQIHDRVQKREMPPASVDPPTEAERQRFARSLADDLIAAHTVHKGTVLRRLNRREYQNTLNDLFGTHVDLESLLPEDGRSQEFDNVAEALGVSLVHLQRYMDAAGLVLDAAIASSTESPVPELIKASYVGTDEARRFVGEKWKELEDGAIVRFTGGGYPSGMIRGSSVRKPGRYRIQVTGYAYQSTEPIIFSVGGTSFARGSEKPIYGFFSFPPGRPGHASSVELEAWIGEKYMIQIEPHGISVPNRSQRQSIDDYTGPGLAILNVTLEGPLLDEFPSRGHRLVLDGLDRREIPPRNPADRQKSWYVPSFEIVSADETADATRSLERVITAAYRRPATSSDVATYVRLFEQERQQGTTFEDALRTAVTAVLCSSKFLYLQEPPGPLDDYALAARLSYFLIRTTPDAELLEQAAAGRLTGDPVALEQQALRLLEDPRSERFVVDFCNAWLDLREMDFTVPDTKLFPEFDAYLRFSMPLESYAFLRELITANLPVANIVQSDFAMLNGRLAEHYGIAGVHGPEVRRIPLAADSVRGGVLSQASVLKVAANGTNTSPVTRGVWVLERLQGVTPPPPPAGVPGVEPDIRGATTLRELLDKHRSLDTCRGCHQQIDPPGFALESFNPIGGWRDRFRSLGEGERVTTEVNGRRVVYRLGPVVDASGELPDGRTFSGFLEFRDLLAEHSEVLARTMTTKLLTFATGREMGFSDRQEIQRIVSEAANSDYGVRDLLLLTVQSDLFRRK